MSEHPTADLAALQARLHYVFANPQLLRRALTHRSFSADHYERLEFLGDSVLGMAVSGLLYQRLGEQAEGDLSRVRANLVRQETLHQLALELELPGVVRLGEGEMRSGGQRRPSILADVVEALIGAIYLDGGFEAAQAFVHRLFASMDITPKMQAAGKDPKTELQEWLQARKMKPPIYRVVATLGAAHRQTFDVECEVPERGHSERGIGNSRRSAEQAAALAVLAHVKASNP